MAIDSNLANVKIFSGSRTPKPYVLKRTAVSASNFLGSIPVTFSPAELIDVIVPEASIFEDVFVNLDDSFAAFNSPSLVFLIS